MNKLNGHPCEQEVDRVVQGLGGDLAKIKHVTASGIIYDFVFGAGVDSGVPAYLALPAYVPTRNENLFRLEFTLGECEADEVARAIFVMTLDLDMHRNSALRIVPRTKEHRTYQIMLQCVSSVDLVREGFIAATVVSALELAEFYRATFLQVQPEAA